MDFPTRVAAKTIMTGLAVECALKAYLVQAVKQHDFPDKEFVNSIYTHKLKRLAELDAALWQELKSEMAGDVRLQANWNTVLLWNDELRYDFVEKLQAESLYAAATEAETGVVEWIRRRWK